MLPFFPFINILFFGITTPGNHYSPFLAEHFNYIQGLRWFLLRCTAFMLHCFGISTVVNNYELLAAGHNTILLVYSCLGLGILSFFTAFVIAYPKPLKAKIVFFLTGAIAIQLLNIIRLALIAVFWDKEQNKIIDHHTIFNVIIYIIIAISLYFWVKNDVAVKK